MPDNKLHTYVEVQLPTVGKPIFYDTGRLTVKCGDFVVVETARGNELGQVTKTPPVTAEHPPLLLDNSEQPQVGVGKIDKKSRNIVVRLATRDDIVQARRSRIQVQEALAVIRSRAAEYELPMKVLDAFITLDGNRIIIEFAAETRVDFRLLVRDLASRLKKRIELHQIGPRDRAILTEGMGVCGRKLCCACWLKDFSSVSIKMAKIQGLSLNPTKVSGACGRLMCCLKYEYQTYRDYQRSLPKVGDRLLWENEWLEVNEVSLCGNYVTAISSQGNMVKLSADEAREAESTPGIIEPSDNMDVIAEILKDDDDNLFKASNCASQCKYRLVKPKESPAAKDPDSNRK